MIAVLALVPAIAAGSSTPAQAGERGPVMLAQQIMPNAIRRPANEQVRTHAQGTLGKDGREQDQAREALRLGQVKSYAEIKRLIQKSYQGRIIDVHLDSAPGARNYVYRLRVLTPEGRVLRVNVDANTGRFLKVSRAK